MTSGGAFAIVALFWTLHRLVERSRWSFSPARTYCRFRGPLRPTSSTNARPQQQLLPQLMPGVLDSTSNSNLGLENTNTKTNTKAAMLTSSLNYGGSAVSTASPPPEMGGIEALGWGPTTSGGNGGNSKPDDFITAWRVVILTYRRHKPLQKLLCSLEEADYGRRDPGKQDQHLGRAASGQDLDVIPVHLDIV